MSKLKYAVNGTLLSVIWLNVMASNDVLQNVSWDVSISAADTLIHLKRLKKVLSSVSFQLNCSFVFQHSLFPGANVIKRFTDVSYEFS
jgi:hypothetical protein